MLPISVTVLTYNSQEHLKKTLSSLKDFQQVIVLDSGSTDQTEQISSQFSNVSFHLHPFEGFGQQHNHALTLCKYDWILSIDSDEILTRELIEEIKNLKLENNQIYTISRKNYFKGRWISGCGWYPDRVKRLFNKNQTQFSDDKVHESLLEKNLHIQHLKEHIIHYPYSNYRQFLIKMERYCYFFALQNKGIKTSSPFKAFSRALYTFFKSYFLKHGFLNGFEGFFISLYNAETVWHKYIQLYELNNQN